MPFGSFKTVDYIYVPKHNLQIIGQTYDYLQNRHDVAVAQESELKNKSVNSNLMLKKMNLNSFLSTMFRVRLMML